jgi:hypothetical protein
MKFSQLLQILRNRVATALCLLLSSVSPALSAAESTFDGIPEPFLPVSELGEYKPAIENMQHLLKEGRHAEFYSISRKFIVELNKANHREKRFEAKTREEGMAKEWACYLIAGAPLMVMDDFFPLGKLPEKTDLLVDLYAKTSLEGTIQAVPRGAVRESEKKSYERKNGYAYEELFTPEEQRKIQIAHVAYYAAVLKGYRLAHLKTTVERKVDTYLQTPGYGSKPLPSFSNSVMTREELRGARAKARKEDAENNPNIAMKLFDLKIERFGTLISSGILWNNISKETFAKLVVDCFPNDGASVREYFRKAGFPSDIFIAATLQSVYPRMKRTAWIFEGLPDEETTEDFLTTNLYLKNEFYQKEFQEIKKATEEAVALKERATQRFNLLAAKFKEEGAEEKYREHHRKTREAIEKEMQTAAANDTLETWIALRKAELSLFTRLEKQLVLQLQATKEPTLLPPMQKYKAMIVEEKEKVQAELQEKLATAHADNPTP